MADQPDLDQLAKQYLDLWQDHMQSMAADPQISETMSQMTQMMTGSATAFAALAQQALNSQNSGTAGKTSDSETHDPEEHGQGTGDAPATETATDAATNFGTPPAAPSHGGSDLDLAELARRLDSIERRLADLEAGTGGTRKKPGKSPSKRST